MKKNGLIILLLSLLFTILFVGISSLKFRLVSTEYQQESSSRLLLRNQCTDENIVYFNEVMTLEETENLKWYFDKDYHEIWQGEHAKSLNRSIIAVFETIWSFTASLIIWLALAIGIRFFFTKKSEYRFEIHDSNIGSRPSFWSFFKYDFIFRRVAFGSRNYIYSDKKQTGYTEVKYFYIVTIVISVILALIINYELTYQIFVNSGSEKTGLLPINNVARYINDFTVLIKVLIIYKLLSFRYLFTKFEKKIMA